MPLGNRYQRHLSVDSSIKGKIGMLRIGSVIFTIVCRDHHAVFTVLDQRGDIEAKTGKAALVPAGFFPVYKYHCRLAHCAKFDPKFIFKDRSVKLCRVPAGATVVVAPAVLPVKSVPCVWKQHFFHASKVRGLGVNRGLCKIPAII